MKREYSNLVNCVILNNLSADIPRCVCLFSLSINCLRMNHQQTNNNLLL